mmetsp:Transcript_133/g.233  ORF Transcript_133/g.233 Transcript_133/m.233 type:complete len:96 (+) Transcript_133:42-329(+)
MGRMIQGITAPAPAAAIVFIEASAMEEMLAAKTLDGAKTAATTEAVLAVPLLWIMTMTTTVLLGGESYTEMMSRRQWMIHLGYLRNLSCQCLRRD